jgi:cold shock CspA family protein
MARFDGKLIKWNDDRGFGFVTAHQSDSEIFVHISAFPKDGKRPCVGDPLTCELDVDKEGKKRAVNVVRPVFAREKTNSRSVKRNSPSRFNFIVVLLLLASLAAYSYTQFSRRIKNAQPSQFSQQIRPETPIISRHISETPAITLPQKNMRCDGRAHCSQMTSCAEATFFLQNCPGTQMDGDNDGTPCEQQWCTNWFSK